ncbi:hypothetical protein LXL04_014317 [Taraxacum kok-saghyz]
MHIFSFVSKTLKYLKLFYRSPHNRYLKLHICKKKQKKLHIYKNLKKNRICGFFFSANYIDYERFGGSQSRFFERNNGLGDIRNWGNSRCWDLLRTHIFPRTRELPQFRISPKPLFLSKNRLRNPPKPVLKQNKKLCTYAQKKSLHICKSLFSEFFFATGLIFERFLAPRSRFFEKVNGLGVLGDRIMYIYTFNVSQCNTLWTNQSKNIDNGRLDEDGVVLCTSGGQKKTSNFERGMMKFGKYYIMVFILKRMKWYNPFDCDCSYNLIANARQSGSFDNSYIPENPRTLKPLNILKNRLREAKNHSNTNPVAKINFRKNDFFFLFLHMCNFFFHMCNFFFALFFKFF